MERIEAVNVQKNIAGVARGGFMMTYHTRRHETTSFKDTTRSNKISNPIYRNREIGHRH